MMNEKIQIDIYKGLPMILKKVKGIAISSAIGKPTSWIYQKLDHYIVGGVEKKFFDYDVELLNSALESLGNEISMNLVVYDSDRENVILQIKELSKILVMSYIYTNALQQKESWYKCRMLARKPGGKATSFKEDDILKINMAAMQIANELRSIEFVMK